MGQGMWIGIPLIVILSSKVQSHTPIIPAPPSPPFNNRSVLQRRALMGSLAVLRTLQHPTPVQPPRVRTQEEMYISSEVTQFMSPCGDAKSWNALLLFCQLWGLC